MYMYIGVVVDVEFVLYDDYEVMLMQKGGNVFFIFFILMLMYFLRVEDYFICSIDVNMW